MKTLKSLFAISAILLVSGYTYASGKGPGDSKNANSTVREKIASAIESSDIQGKGEVTVKFGVTDKSNLEILNVESADKNLTKEVKDALAASQIRFPQGSEGVYKVKVRVNEMAENASFESVREQVFGAVSNIEADKSESVSVKLRVVHPDYVKVLKAESDNPKLAQKVEQSLNSGKISVPKNLNGDYNVKVTFKQ